MARAGALWSDSLAEQASEAGISGIQDYLDTAEERLASGDNHEAIHNARMALERVVKSIANRVADTVAGRAFGNALDVIEARGIIDRSTRIHLGAPNVSAYGWLSVHGSHEDEESEAVVLRRAAEGRYGVAMTRGAIRLILDAFAEFQRGTESPSER
ncbi:hypothetical protein [Candidatus Amarobacter glycogenicus]|uniref:hypothetical protein n=1 Tax=Candidatus Amarobacter glycogenicus TaxID=3140699 RepID=UPI002A157A22|nr:hypothetical protein [Dehalococcoidia bacterium]